jgi:hypothetical protein
MCDPSDQTPSLSESWILGEWKVEKEVMVEPGQHDRDTAVWWISVDSGIIRLRVVSGGDTIEEI